MRFETITLKDCLDANEKNGAEFVLQDGTVTGIIFKHPGIEGKIKKAVEKHSL